MKKIILALTALMMAGCSNGTQIKYTKHQVTTLDVGEIEYDSCEYILLYEGMAHKGNCRFCNERRQKELEDDDIDLSLVIEQLWEDLQLAHKQISQTMDRNDFYADYYNLDKWDGKFNG